jgi:hypothetical protein
MGLITESFANLSDYLTDEYKKSKKRVPQIDLVISKALKPFLPSGIRIGTGNIADVKDREVGPLDVVASIDSFPPFGDGGAATYLADGVVFALQIRNWAESDLTQFGEMAAQAKKLDRKSKSPIPCLAVSFGLLPLAEVNQFLGSKPGQAVDGILCVGHHVVIRNNKGLYGDPTRVPLVTEQPGPEALKAFTFFLLHLSQRALNLPFGLADYQHL